MTAPAQIEPMRSMLEALVSYVVFSVLLVLWLPLLALARLLTAPFDPTRRVVGWLWRRLATTSVWLSPVWRMRLEGAWPAGAGPYVVVANHESAADIFLLSHLPREVKWLAKASLFRVPWLGWLLRLGGDVPVSRGDRESGSQALERARWYLRRGMSVFLFPEGTRSRDGALLPFKNGAFKLALELGLPILPVALRGTSAQMPAGSPWIRKASAVACILEPVETRGLGLEHLERVREQVRSRIAEARDQLAGEAQ